MRFPQSQLEIARLRRQFRHSKTPIYYYMLNNASRLLKEKGLAGFPPKLQTVQVTTATRCCWDLGQQWHQNGKELRGKVINIRVHIISCFIQKKKKTQTK